jgi:endonuclease/exonuclease/phosphatase family metal-dependent hydrolase
MFGKNREPNPSEGVKIMSYNVRIFDNFKWSGKENSGQMLLDFVAGEKPDIICFQEFMVKSLGDFGIFSIKRKLGNTPYSHTKYSSEGLGKKVGLAIFSKYPIINKGGEFFPGKGQLYIFTDLIIKNDTVRLFNIHLESNHFNQKQVNLIDSLIASDPRDNKSEYIDILKRMKRAYLVRAGQADQIRDAIEESPYPVLVAGDFNDTPVSYTYNTISRRLDDAFVSSGKGIGATYKEFMLPLRIDYILHDKNISSWGYTKHNVDFSDHKPIHAVLDIGGFKRQVR